MGGRRRCWWVYAALSLSLSLCGTSCHRTFACEQDANCGAAELGGRCEVEGYCSFADEGCSSGRRWSSHAAEGFSDACVEPGPEGSTGLPSMPTAGETDASSTSETISTSGGSTGGGSSSTLTLTGAEDASDSSTGPPPGPCDPLVHSDPIVVRDDGATIEHLHIVSDGAPGIRVEGASGVTIRDVTIHHRGAPGIVFAAADGLRIENAIVVHDDAPPTGPHAAGGQANIEGRDSDDVVIERVRVTRGTSLIDLENMPGAQIRFVEGHDVRGPGFAAFVRLHESDDALLEDFSILNPLDTGRPETLVQISSSSNVTVRRGLLDGHNAEFGYGVGFVLIPGQHTGGLVEDVDAIRMTNGGFSCFPWGADITFRRTRARDNICEILSVEHEDCDEPGPNGGCVPGSGGLGWAASLDSTNVTIEDSTHFGLCGATYWPEEVVTVEGLVEADFRARAPIEVAPCWER